MTPRLAGGPLVRPLVTGVRQQPPAVPLGRLLQPDPEPLGVRQRRHHPHHPRLRRGQEQGSSRRPARRRGTRRLQRRPVHDTHPEIGPVQ